MADQSPPMFAATKAATKLYMFSDDDDDDLFTPSGAAGEGGLAGVLSPVVMPTSWQVKPSAAGGAGLPPLDLDDIADYAAIDSAEVSKLTAGHAVPVNPDGFRGRNKSIFQHAGTLSDGTDDGPILTGDGGGLPAGGYRPAFPGERKNAALAAASLLATKAAETGAAQKSPVADAPATPDMPKSPAAAVVPANVKDYEADEVAEMASRPRAGSNPKSPGGTRAMPTVDEGSEDSGGDSKVAAEEYGPEKHSKSMTAEPKLEEDDDEDYDDEDDDDIYDTDDSEIARLTGQPVRKKPGPDAHGRGMGRRPSVTNRIVTKKKKLNADEVKVAVQDVGGVQIAIPEGFDMDDDGPSREEAGDNGQEEDDIDDDEDGLDSDAEERKKAAKKARQDFLDFLGSGPAAPAATGEKASQEFYRKPLAREATTHNRSFDDHSGKFGKLWELKDKIADSSAGEKLAAFRDTVEDKTHIGRGVSNALDKLEDRTNGRVSRRIVKIACWGFFGLLLVTVLSLVLFLPRTPKLRYLAMTSMLPTGDATALKQQLPKLSSDGTNLIAKLGIVLQAEVGGFIAIYAKNATVEVKMAVVGEDSAEIVGTGTLAMPLLIPKSPSNVTLPVTFKLPVPSENTAALTDPKTPLLVRDWLRACGVLKDEAVKTLSLTFSAEFQMTGGVKPELRNVPVEFACPWSTEDLLAVADISRLTDELSGTAPKRTVEALARKKKKKGGAKDDKPEKSKDEDSSETSKDGKDDKSSGKTADDGKSEADAASTSERRRLQRRNHSRRILQTRNV